MDIGYVNSQTFYRDLCQGRFQALTDGLNANPDIESSIRRQPGEGLLIEGAPFSVSGRAMGCLLRKGRYAEADQASVRLALGLPFADGFQIDGGDGPA